MKDIAGKKSVKRHKLKRNAIFVMVYLVIVIFLIGIIYIYPHLSGVYSDTMTLEYKALKKSRELTCYIVKDETVYFANETGKVGYFYPEGEMIRRGSTVISITPDDSKVDSDLYEEYNRRVNSFNDGNVFLKNYKGVALTLKDELNILISESPTVREQNILGYYLSEVENVTKRAKGFKLSDDSSIPKTNMCVRDSYVSTSSGVVSYNLDGYESEFSPHTMKLLDEKAVSTLKSGVFNFSTGVAKKGEPVFKIVDNRKWYVVTWVDAKDLGIFNEGSSVRLELGDTEVEGNVDEVIDHEDKIMLIISCSAYYKSLSNIRSIKANVVTSDENGLLVKNSFIKNKDGVVGVYVLKVDGSTLFTPVKIIDNDGKYSLLKAGNFYLKDESGDSKMVNSVRVYDEVVLPKKK